MTFSVSTHIKWASVLCLTKPNSSYRPMNIQSCIDHNDVPFFFFNIGTYSPRSTKVSLMLTSMLNSTFEPSRTLVLREESIRFCKFTQILFQIG